MAPHLNTGTRYQVLGMHTAGKAPKEISATLNMHLATVYRILKRAEERGGQLKDADRSGRPATKVTKRNIDAVRKRVQKYPTRSINAIAKTMGLSDRTTRRLVRLAGFKSMTKLVVHELMAGQQARRLERARGLLAWRDLGLNKHRDIVFTDEKNFVLQEHHNRRNNRVLVPVAAHDPSLRIVKRRKNPSSVMVFGAMATDGSVMDPIFIPSGVTVNSMTYQSLVLPKLLSWMTEKFGPPSGFRGEEEVGQAVLMQDGAPAHTSNSTQKYLADHLGKENFWNKSAWPPSSPDANPLDFSFWAALAEASTAAGVPQNRAALITRLEDVWHQVLDPSYVRKTCTAAWDRLRRICDADGGVHRAHQHRQGRQRGGHGREQQRQLVVLCHAHVHRQSRHASQSVL